MMTETIEEYVAIWNSRRISDLKNVFSMESKYWDSVQEGDAIEVLTGAVAGTHESFPDVSFEVLGLSSDSDNQYFLEWKMTGTNTGHFFGNPPTGKPIEIKGLDAIKFESDKISELKSFYDTNLFNQQLGI